MRWLLIAAFGTPTRARRTRAVLIVVLAVAVLGNLDWAELDRDIDVVRDLLPIR